MTCVLADAKMHVVYNSMSLLTAPLVELVPLSDKVSQIPGLTDELLFEKLQDLAQPTDYIRHFAANPRVLAQTRLCLYILFRFTMGMLTVSEMTSETLEPFVSDVFLAYRGEIGKVIPIFYFLPRPSDGNDLSLLFEKSFLHRLSLSAEQTGVYEFSNYFVPPITPTPSIFLDVREQHVWFSILKGMDQILRRLGK
jgi:hypothetical protein